MMQILKRSRKTYKFNQRKKKENEDKEPPEIKFESIPEDIPGTWMKSRKYDDEDQALYKRLFEAVFYGRIDVLEQVTVKKEIGKQAHVASRSINSQYSPIHLAIIKNRPKVLQRVIEIAIAQYTPLQPPEKVGPEKTKSINNYDIARLMNQFRPGSFFDASTMAFKQEEFDQIDPNKVQLQLNCITSVASILITNSRWNVMHCAAYYASNEALSTLVKLIETHDIKPSKYPQVTSSPKQVTKTVLQTLFEATNDMDLTPFELAIACGNVSTAALLLQFGALCKGEKAAVPGEAEEEKEEDYKGLDVGGKKMDWALDRQDYLEKKKELEGPSHSALHVAAYYNQARSIEFILSGEAFAAWKKFLNKEITEVPKEFTLADVETGGNTAYHYAVSKVKNLEALQKLLELDTTGVYNQPNKKGITPLHFASSKGFVGSVKALIEKRADLESSNNKGWTALYYAIHGNHPECVSLLVEAKAQIDGALTKTYKQTPLMVAAHYGSIKSVEILLSSGRSDPLVKDACGEMALHHAVREGHHLVVKALLTRNIPEYSMESGLAFTVFDTAMLKLITPFPQHRVDENMEDVPTNPERKLIYDHILKVQTKERILAKNEEVVNVTNIMMDCALAESRAEKKKKRRHYHWHGDEEESQSPDDLHLDGEITAGIQQLPKFTILPEVKQNSDDSDIALTDDTDKEDAPKSLKGMTFAITGSFSTKQENLVKIINEHGGTYASSITKAVTHVLASDPDTVSEKLIKAKSEGKKIVGESFLKNVMKKEKEVKKKKEKSKKRESSESDE